MALYTLKIPKDSPQHKKLKDLLEPRINLGKKGNEKQHPKWKKAEELTLAYIPESDADSIRRNQREGGEPKYTTIQVPHTYALLMSAHTYWTSVFFARNPVHQYTGRHGEGEMQVQALEALISYQVDVGEMLAPYYIWLYDSGKYGAGIIGEYWTVDKIHYGELVEMGDPATGQTQVYQATQEVMGYQGNKAYNVAPYDFMHDPRVPLSKFQEGEFCICRCRLGWNQIIRRQDQGYYMNVEELKKVETVKKSEQGSSALGRPDFSDESLDNTIGMDNKRTNHPAGMTFYEVYVDLIPFEWGVGSSKYPQKWCFTITEDMTLIVGASPVGYMHGKFPFSVIEPEVEAYGVYNRGIPEIMEPIQNVMDWLINSHFFNVRASMNNQFIVDPSKLVINDVKKSGPGFLWRLRPEAYGQDLSKMFYQVPVQDVTRAHIADFQAMLGIGERTLGINDQIMGALNASGRKTATEVRTTTGFGVNRLKTTTEYMSATGLTAHSQKLVQSSQQYYDMQGKLRIVGDLAQDAGPAFMNVTPELIAGFYSFVPVDGVLPIDRMAQANLWKDIFANLQRMPPQISMEYNWSKMFGWMASLAGLKNIHQFKLQVVPNEQLQQQADMGNVIPLPNRPAMPGLPGADSSTQSGNNALY